MTQFQETSHSHSMKLHEPHGFWLASVDKEMNEI